MKNLPWISALILGTFVALTAAGCQQVVKRVSPSNSAAQNTTGQQDAVANSTVNTASGEQGDGSQTEERYSNEKMGLSVERPAGHRIEEADGFVAFYPPDYNENLGDAPQDNASIQFAKEGSAQAAVDAIVTRDPQFNVIEVRRNVTINGLTAIEVKHRTAFGVDVWVTFVEAHGKVYMIEDQGDQGVAYRTLRDTFRAI